MSHRLAVLAVVLLLSLAGTATAMGKVLFYEVGTTDDYKIDKGYSEFAKALRNKGYVVASITRGELSKDALTNYDILVVQELGKSLSTDEISSIIWFVLQQGKGVLINGAGQSRANQLTIPFGVTIDGGTLIDTEDQIGNDRNSFTLSSFDENPELKTMQLGVTKVGFYKGNGFLMSGNSKCILRGDDDTYSDTGSFPTGSKPCVSSASLFGNGLVVVLSDADVLSNKNIKSYNNRNFGVNIIDWLGIPTIIRPENQTVQGLMVLIGEIKLENAKFSSDIQKLTVEKETLQTQNKDLNTRLELANQENYELKNQMIGPFNKLTWAVIGLGLSILMFAIVYSKKKAEAKPAEADMLNELGYELEGGVKSSSDEKTKDDGLGDLGV